MIFSNNPIVSRTSITPQMFGAKGDGINDDTIAFANALAFSSDIRIPIGRYIVNVDLSNMVNFKFEGSGSGTVLVAADTSKPIIKINSTTVQTRKGIIADMALVGISSGTASTGIELSAVSPWSIKGLDVNNLNITNVTGGIHIIGTTAGEIYDNYFHNIVINNVNGVGGLKSTNGLYNKFNNIEIINIDGNTSAISESGGFNTYSNCQLEGSIFLGGRKNTVKTTSIEVITTTSAHWGTDAAIGMSGDHLTLDGISLINVYGTKVAAGISATGGVNFNIKNVKFEYTGGTTVPHPFALAAGTTGILENIQPWVGVYERTDDFHGESILANWTMINNGFLTRTPSLKLPEVLLGKIIITHGTTIPTTGKWYVGDRVINSIPSVGQPKSWACSVAGGANSTTRDNLTEYALSVWAIWTTGTTVWKCTTAGTTAASPPSIVGKVVGNTVVDGDAVWTMQSETTAIFVSEGNL